MGTQFSQEKFDEMLMKMLTEHGREGWDLKGVIYEGGLHAHFIFGCEAARKMRVASTMGRGVSDHVWTLEEIVALVC